MWKERDRQRKRVSSRARDNNENKIALSTIQIENHRNENDVFERERFYIIFVMLLFDVLVLAVVASKLDCWPVHWDASVCVTRHRLFAFYSNFNTDSNSKRKKTKTGLKSIYTEYQADRKNGTMVGRSIYDVNENAVMMVFHHGGWRFWIVAHTRDEEEK